MTRTSKSFWSSLPGILTALAGLLTACTGLYLALRPSTVRHDVSLLTGTWHYSLASSVAGTTHEGSMSLTQKGRILAGVMDVWDGSKGEIAGTVEGSNVKLTRDTGLNTIQEFTLTGTDRSLSGVFSNTGKYLDNGTITLQRE